MFGRKMSVLFSFAFAMIMTAGSATAVTIQIQDGRTVAGNTYAGTETAWIHSGVPNSVVGANTLIRVGFADTNPDEVYRTLVRFGQLSHFAGVTPAALGFDSTQITGARIILYRRDGEGSGSVQLHVLDSADEGWTESFTTWNNKRTDVGTPPPTGWSQGPGIGSAYGSIVGTANPFSSSDAAGTAMTFELTGNTDAMNTVKDWVSGANTSGTFFLRAATEDGTSNHYNSWHSEQATVSDLLKPMLEIDYVVPEPTTTTSGMLLLGSLAMLRRRK